MKDNNELQKWLYEITDGASVSAIARAINVPQRTLANHVRTGALLADEIISIARAYGRSPIYALVDNGALTREECDKVARDELIYELPVRELLRIALDRLDRELSALGYVVESDSACMLPVSYVSDSVLNMYVGEAQVKDFLSEQNKALRHRGVQTLGDLSKPDFTSEIPELPERRSTSDDQ